MLALGDQSNGLATRPFLKWAGGKRWLARFLAELSQEPRGRHVEPFLGSGAFFFLAAPRRALLADSNQELIAAFRAVRDDPHALIKGLSRLEINPSTFESVRARRPRSDVGKAIRLIYLNKTAFNGLYRVNQQGRFNVPFGCKPTTVLCEPSALLACSTALSNAEITHADFRDTLKRVRKHDLVYADSPYTVRHNLNAFRRYNQQLFGWDDQLDLAFRLNILASRGVRIVASNALHRDVQSLYDSDNFVGFSVQRPSNMAASSKHRGRSYELLLISRTAQGVPYRLRSIMNRRFRPKPRNVPLGEGCP